jgi:hypothetical protein
MKREIIRLDDPRVPSGILANFGRMPFNDRYELVGFRHQLTGKMGNDGVMEDALVPVWKDHKICRDYVRSKY